MNSDQTEIGEAVAAVRKELAALRVTLEANEQARGETRGRATVFEAEIVARLVKFEARFEEICSVADAKLAEMDRRLDQRIAEHLNVEPLVRQLQEEMFARLETVEGTVSRLSAETVESRQMLARLETVEGAMGRLEAETAEARQFVRSLRSLRLLRVRRRILQRLHG